jgi:FkbM family methyltransferase
MRKQLLRINEKCAKTIRTLLQPESWNSVNYGVDPDTYQIFNQPWFLNSNIRTVVDIGANTGQFTLLSNQLLPDVQIYAFEPSPDCFKQLSTSTEHISNIHIFNFALGDCQEEKDFYQNSFSQASSLLVPTSTHDINYPFSMEHQSIGKIQVRMLDSFASDVIITDNLLIKMDVQGYEDRVIRGGEKIICRASIVLVETSFVELYQSSPLFHDIYYVLVKLGFKFDGFIAQSRSNIDGKMLWADAVFLKNNQSI